MPRRRRAARRQRGATRSRVHRDAACAPHADVVDGAQPETGALARWLRRQEPDEDPGPVGVGDPLVVVLDDDQRTGACAVPRVIAPLPSTASRVISMRLVQPGSTRSRSCRNALGRGSSLDAHARRFSLTREGAVWTRAQPRRVKASNRRPIPPRRGSVLPPLAGSGSVRGIKRVDSCHVARRCSAKPLRPSVAFGSSSSIPASESASSGCGRSRPVCGARAGLPGQDLESHSTPPAGALTGRCRCRCCRGSRRELARARRQ